MGNGFDIAHGIKSSYSDFYTYLKTFEVQPKLTIPGFPKYIDINSVSLEDRKKQELIRNLEKYIPREDLWSSFEEALGELDYDQLLEDNLDYLIDPGDDNWSDSSNHDYQYMIQEELKFTEDIDYQFKRWISRLNINVNPLESVINILSNCNNSTGFISFNYTDTLEKIYYVNRNNILYIHGKANEGVRLILGHHNNSYMHLNQVDTRSMTEEEYSDYSEYIQEKDFREIEAESAIRNYFEITYKDTKKIINCYKAYFSGLYDCKKIYILGHSLSTIDFDYFKEIKENTTEDCKWIISVYSQYDINRAKQFVQCLNILVYELINL